MPAFIYPLWKIPGNFANLSYPETENWKTKLVTISMSWSKCYCIWSVNIENALKKKYLEGFTPARVGIFVASRFAISPEVCLVENWMFLTLLSCIRVSIRDLRGIAFIEVSSCRKWKNVLVTDVFLSTLPCHLYSMAEACVYFRFIEWSRKVVFRHVRFPFEQISVFLTFCTD